MKRYFLALLIAVISFSTVSAQSMTDDQVMQFVLKEHSAGTSQAQIVTKLMQKGVDINQIRRIKAKYERQSKNGGLGLVKDETVGKTEDGMRVNNGDTKESLAQKKLNRKNKNKNKKNSKNYREIDENSSHRVGAVRNSNVKNENGMYDDEDNESFDEMNGGVLDLLGDEYLTGDFMMEVDPTYYRGRKVFGRDIFNKEDLTFEPVMNIATPQNYVVGPGDEVKVDIYGASQKSSTYTVSPDGDIVIDGYGPVNLAGLTVKQANARLRSTVGSRFSSSSIKLSLGQTRTIMVNVMGEVQNPGTYSLSAFASVFHALYMAGGVSGIGTLRNIKVFRNGKEVSTVDVYDYILNGKLSGNIRLHDNDVIMVGPYDCIVDIAGKVKRPMYYEMKTGESVQTLLKYAGNFAGDAYTKSVRIIRKNGSRYGVFNVQEFDMASFHVMDGDSVTVDSIIPRYENMVEVKGAVFRPGMYQLGGNITTVRALIENAEGLLEDAFTARAVMHRMNEDRTLKVISVDVKGIIDGNVADIPLKNEDVLFIPSKSERLESRTITIHGEVLYPGVYKYAENETLEDFVLQAGGLKESASTVKVDISRRVSNRTALTRDSLISKTYSFALKDGFVIDGKPGFVLEPYDEVYVRKSPSYSIQQNVSIEGEVNFPGTYALAKQESRLSDLVKAAGGTNRLAYVKGARLERKITPEERTRMEQVLKMAQSQSDGEDTIDVRKLDLGDTYYVGIQLDKAIESPGSDFDLTLRESDRIIVPEYTNTVKVSGNVLYPNTIAYKKGKGARYYVNQAGGWGSRAKKGSTYIVHMNGTVNQMGKGEKPTPGSEVIVPTKPKSENNKLSQWLAIGTSTASIATMVATIANLIK
ncbi:MAG: SLBB domain-containing protein [Prevotellaceae bacterium]|nr:SLBB domain-containing protein [Prevotellaceae bacterium]